MQTRIVRATILVAALAVVAFLVFRPREDFTSISTCYPDSTPQSASQIGEPAPRMVGYLKPIFRAPDFWPGDTLVEQKILDSDVIVRATMTSCLAGVTFNGV